MESSMPFPVWWGEPQELGLCVILLACSLSLEPASETEERSGE